MIKKGIFGGTFDPIHNAHMYIAYEALYQLELNKIIFMPGGNPPHKRDKNITDSNIRYELIKLATRKENCFEVSSYEIDKKSLNFTYETMEYHKAMEPDTEWYFITGADCLRDLHMWKNIDRIFNVCNFVVFNRPNVDKDFLMKEKLRIEKLYKKDIIFLDLKLIDISSSMIREMIRKNMVADYFIPSGVYNTIQQLGLYK